MTPLAEETRKTGIDIVGEMPWGTHFCLFYETKEDLLDILVPYCKAGLESEEFCIWVVAEPLTVDEAKGALQASGVDIERYLADSSIEIVSARDWYLQAGAFDLERVMASWHRKVAEASAKGYVGVRVTGDTAWLAKKDWEHFCEYEEALNHAVADRRLAVLCTYPLAACGALEILDVVRTHQFALARRHGTWDLIETAGLKLAKSEIKRLNDELEQRVLERTHELMRASEALREAQAELAHVNRVATIGQLTATIAHEVNQPIAATITNAQVAQHLLGRRPPNLKEVRQALDDIVKCGERAAAVIGRIRALIKKAPPREGRFDLNEAVLDVAALIQSEVLRHGVSLQTELAPGLRSVVGDRVQLQQVILNLAMNSIEAMTGIGPRELLISTARDHSDGALVAVRDSGPGLDPQRIDRLFEAFYTTKTSGMGMGLAICRSIVEAHGGRVWASANEPRGAVFQFTLPPATDETVPIKPRSRMPTLASEVHSAIP